MQLRYKKWGEVDLERASKVSLEKGGEFNHTSNLVRCDEAGFGRANEVKTECARSADLAVRSADLADV